MPRQALRDKAVHILASPMSLSEENTYPQLVPNRLDVISCRAVEEGTLYCYVQS
jgi:hypothetical protein